MCMKNMGQYLSDFVRHALLKDFKKSFVHVHMRDNKCVIHQVFNVVDDGYKIDVDTSAEFKVFSQHTPYNYRYRMAQFRLG